MIISVDAIKNFNPEYLNKFLQVRATIRGKKYVHLFQKEPFPTPEPQAHPWNHHVHPLFQSILNAHCPR